MKGTPDEGGAWGASPGDRDGDPPAQARHPVFPDLSRRRPDLVEAMDHPGCDPERLARTYHHFPRVNRLLAGWPRLYRRWGRPLVRRGEPFRILDVGCGGGDILRVLVALAARDGARVEALGIDPDPRAIRFASERLVSREGPGRQGSSRETEPPAIRYLQATSRELLAGRERFHLVVSNHVLHHLPDQGVAPFLEELRALALGGGRGRVLVSDIARSQVGYLLFGGVVGPFFPGSHIRGDGLLSIRRSFTPNELRDEVPPGWEVDGDFPFRIVARAEGVG
jgi:2-polyprenyl-3-methyl-5-hydroxy-6-metoxy-1,4-benzoquinol methylase